jgi:multiple sugar transport system substrate-binding protein
MRTFRPRMLILALLALSAGGCMSACGQEERPDNVVQLKLWSATPPEYGPASLVAEWNRRHPGIQVELMSFVNNDAGNTRMDTALLSHNEVDVFIGYHTDLLAKRIDSGVVEPLDDWLTKDGLTMGDLIEPGLATKHHEHHYYIPASYTFQGVLINRDALEAAGESLPSPDWTLEELVRLARKLTVTEGTEVKRYGLTFSHGPSIFAADLAASYYGGYGMYREDGRTNFDEPIWTRLLAAHRTMELEDRSLYPYAAMLERNLSAPKEYLAGRSAMLWGSHLIRNVKELEQSEAPFVTAIVPSPRIEKGGPYFNGYGTSDFVSMSAASVNKEAAWAFMKWFVQEGIDHMVPHGRIPTERHADREAVLQHFLKGYEPLFDIPSFRSWIHGSYTYSFPTDNVPHREISALLRDELARMLLDGQTPEQTALRMKERGDWLLQQVDAARMGRAGGL